MNSKSDFFRLSNPMIDIAVAGSVGSDSLRAFIEATLARSKASREFTVRQIVGRKFSDLLWVDVLPLVSGRTLKVLSGHRITGWSIFPVRVLDGKGGEVPDYHGLQIVGRCSTVTIDKDHSELVYEKSPRGLFPHYKGLYFDSQSWDRSDLFAGADGRTAFIVATEKVKLAFEQEGISNCEFTPMSEVRLPATDQPVITTSSKLY